MPYQSTQWQLGHDEYQYFNFYMWGHPPYKEILSPGNMLKL